jgi:WhiB family redox-sensing transcriptional regulator
VTDLDWMEQAACVGSPTMWWFRQRRHVERDIVREDPYTAAAKRVCQSCPVQSVCRDYAVENHEKHGLWGGMSLEERDQYHRKIVARRKTA